MSEKTFVDVVESKVHDFFREFDHAPEYISFLVNGFPVAVAAYLSSQLYENHKAESELVINSPSGKIMRFGLKATRKGDAVAFLPEFELLDAGKEYINSDEVEFDSVLLEELSRSISNPEFIKILKEAWYGKIYVNGEWFDDPKVATCTDKGLTFIEDSDVAICAAVVIYSIIEILCNFKESTCDVTYEIERLGTFKISPVKNGYNVTLTFDKEFKSTCKSDILAEQLLDVIPAE